MIPHTVSDPEYLAKNGFELVDSRQNVASEGAVTPDVLSQLRAWHTFRSAEAGPKERARTGEIYLSQQLQRLHARHSRDGTISEV
jgi:hypothetical protein